MKKLTVVLAVFVAILLSGSYATSAGKTEKAKDQIKFTDVKAQTLEFINYYNTIKLTKEQEKLKNDTLSAIPAPCCSKFSMATCCCPCNLGKSVWGLSNYLIAKKNYDSAQLRVAVLDWLMFTNKGVYAGDACFAGRCGNAFRHDGCGGMKEKEVVF